MKFPIKVQHRRQEAVIYGRTPACQRYRVAWYSGGKRHIQKYRTYTDARQAAERVVRQLAEGNPVLSLTPGEASDAITAREVPERFRRETGREISLAGAMAELLEATTHLPEGVSLTEAVKRYASTLSVLRRKEITDAVELFRTARVPCGRSTRTHGTPD